MSIKMPIKASFKTRIAALAVAALAATGSIAASTQAAHAGPKGDAIGAGLLGAVIIGAAIAASSTPSYAYGYPSYRHCTWQPQYNVFGQFVGHGRVCYYP